jgi:hypothetical protein
VRSLERRIQARQKAGLNTVVPDVRFPNEARAIKNWGGLLIRVDRAVAGASGGIEGHASENSLISWTDWDVVIPNNRTLEDLENCVADTMRAIKEPNP